MITIPTRLHQQPNSAVTAQKMLVRFLSETSTKGLSKATIKNYRSDLNQFIEFSQTSNLEALLSRSQVIMFIRFQIQKGLKANSVIRKIASITQFALWNHEQKFYSGDVEWLRLLTHRRALESSNLDQLTVEPAQPQPTALPQTPQLPQEQTEAGPSLVSLLGIALLDLAGLLKNGVKRLSHPLRLAASMAAILFLLTSFLAESFSLGQTISQVSNYLANVPSRVVDQLFPITEEETLLAKDSQAWNKGQVLASADDLRKSILLFHIPTNFTSSVSVADLRADQLMVSDDTTLNGQLTLGGNVSGDGVTVDLGGGQVLASNI